MIGIDEALRCYRERIVALAARDLSLDQALQAGLAAALESRCDQPPFTQSAMDGYAVRSADLAQASAEAPLRLPLSLHCPAGPVSQPRQLEAGSCARIFTGGLLPDGADAVVIQENVSVFGEQVEFHAPPARGDNVRLRGEEIAAATGILQAGHWLDAQALAVAAWCGIDTLPARRPPSVHLIVTGDELIAPGQTLRPGELYECNARFLGGWLRQLGCTTTSAHCPDQPEQLRAQLSAALDTAQLVLISGGASVGERDFGKDAARACGVEEHFWKVAQKPGKPIWFGSRDGTPVLILPGNPASAFACAVVHLRAVVAALQGVSMPPPAHGVLASETRADPHRDRLLRARACTGAAGVVEIEILPDQASHMLANLARANALARIPAGDPLRAGDTVSWWPTAATLSWPA